MPGDRAGPVAGILLAAGTSSRMGENKLLFELEGEAIVRRAARRASAAGFDPLIVVVGHEADAVRRALSGISCRLVENARFADGINGSVKVGVRALPATTAAVVVMLADMPFVTTEMLTTLIDRCRADTAPLVISDYEGVNAPPMLYRSELFSELLVMEGEGCGRQVVRKHRGEAYVVSFAATALTDLDVPDDWQRVRSQLAAARS